MKILSALKRQTIKQSQNNNMQLGSTDHENVLCKTEVRSKSKFMLQERVN